MNRKHALIAACLILTACAKPSDDLPRPLPPLPVTDPRVCADPEPEPPVMGSIVAPVTVPEVEATKSHLESDADARRWGRRGWEIVAIARKQCGG